ncbi:MAG TPA: DUF1552 domain-containing protein [Polyangia bacterium]|nr:DUF1552 domain-containing protein [Polyangia bacterium]
MKTPKPMASKAQMNRRAFLRAGSVAIGLPFLEGLPERSAWAANSPPTFAFFTVAACGVVGKSFFPAATGALTSAGLMGATDKAVSPLAPHAANLLFVNGVSFPLSGPTNCGHAQGLCQSLTGVAPQGGGQSAASGGMSVDMVIAPKVNANKADPMTLYAGNRKNGYIAERISFKAGGAGNVRSADDNPYTLYSKLMGMVGTGGTTTPPPSGMLDELASSRKSVNDFVRDELNSLMGMSALSTDDRKRLQQHFDSIRDTEKTMTGMAATAAGCTIGSVNVTKLNALQSGLAFKMDGMIEDVAKLHFELVALAFACNYNRVGTMQWGDGTDHTIYNVASNKTLGNWNFHYISHRTQSDGASGSNSTAETAHHEIDTLRMQTLAYGIDQFKQRGLLDKSLILWTNHVADGPSHSMKNVPMIIAGNGGGYLKQGQYITASGTNDKLLNTLITAAIRDTGATGSVGSGGELDAIKA